MPCVRQIKLPHDRVYAFCESVSMAPDLAEEKWTVFLNSNGRYGPSRRAFQVSAIGKELGAEPDPPATTGAGHRAGPAKPSTARTPQRSREGNSRNDHRPGPAKPSAARTPPREQQATRTLPCEQPVEQPQLRMDLAPPTVYVNYGVGRPIGPANQAWGRPRNDVWDSPTSRYSPFQTPQGDFAGTHHGMPRKGEVLATRSTG
jgi:hypothetical protein